jgi:hypothetical protein
VVLDDAQAYLASGSASASESGPGSLSLARGLALSRALLAREAPHPTRPPLTLEERGALLLAVATHAQRQPTCAAALDLLAHACLGEPNVRTSAARLQRCSLLFAPHQTSLMIILRSRRQHISPTSGPLHICVRPNPLSVDEALGASERIQSVSRSGASHPQTSHMPQETLEYVYSRVTGPLLVGYGLGDTPASATPLPAPTEKMAQADAADSIRMAATVRCHLSVWLERAARGMVKEVGHMDVSTATDVANGGGVGGEEGYAQRRSAEGERESEINGGKAQEGAAGALATAVAAVARLSATRDSSGETEDASSSPDWQAAGWLMQRSGEAHALHWLLRRHGAGCATLAAAAAAALVGAASDTARLAHALSSGACCGGSRTAAAPLLELPLVPSPSPEVLRALALL